MTGCEGGHGNDHDLCITHLIEALEGRDSYSD